MKHYVLIILLSFMPIYVLAQFDVMPDSPLDTNMEGASELRPADEEKVNQDEERQEEMLENKYDVPDEEEEEEFNENEN